MSLNIKKKKIPELLKEEILVGAAGILFLAALLVFFGVNWQTRPVFGQWSEPATTPPAANKPTPILESGNQTRVGYLAINNDLTVNGNVSLQNNWFLFPNLSGSYAIISDQGNYILVGSSTNSYFHLITEGNYSGRFAIGAPAPTNPAQTLRVQGTAQITGNATTTGTLTLNSRANACILISFSASCASDYLLVGVRNNSGVLVNPSPSPTSGFKICCKKY